MSLSAKEQHSVARRVVRVVAGRRTPTPTPSMPTVNDIGLLHFLNEKQSALHQILLNRSINDCPQLGSVTAFAEFMGFVVGGLIVEAEKVDECILRLKKELMILKDDFLACDSDLQYYGRAVSTPVVQAIASHYRPRLSVPQRQQLHPNVEQLGTEENAKVEHLSRTITELRDRLKHGKAQLGAMTKVQRILHGTGGRVSAKEAADLVKELGILSTFRKALHRVRDAVYDVDKAEELEPVGTLCEFITYLDWGVTAALQDMEAAELSLHKEALAAGTEAVFHDLDHQDAVNKQMSAAALRMNERAFASREASASVRHPQQQAQQTTAYQHQQSAAPAASPSQPPPPASERRHSGQPLGPGFGGASPAGDEPANPFHDVMTGAGMGGATRFAAPRPAHYTPPALAVLTPSTHGGAAPRGHPPAPAPYPSSYATGPSPFQPHPSAVSSRSTSARSHTAPQHNAQMESFLKQYCA